MAASRRLWRLWALATLAAALAVPAAAGAVTAGYADPEEDCGDVDDPDCGVAGLFRVVAADGEENRLTIAIYNTRFSVRYTIADAGAALTASDCEARGAAQVCTNVATSLLVDLRDGDDSVRLSESRARNARQLVVASIFGGAGNDVAVAAEGNDLLDGGTGSDRLTGGIGNDRILGGADADRLAGGAGDDALVAGAGDDSVFGGRGKDRFSAGAGDDRVDAVDGRRELILCGPGDDSATIDRVDRASGCERVARR